VTVPRRTFLQGTADVTALAVAPPGVRPAERFLLARRALRDNDNLFGPRDVIPLAVRQLQIMHHVADGLRGAERYELLLPQIQFADLLGWLYQDSCDYAAARHWFDRALEWAHLLGDHSCVTFILCRKTQLACDTGQAVPWATFFDPSYVEVYQAQSLETRSARILTELAALETAVSRAADTPADPRLARATIYSTLEPCSQRKSRPRTCTQLILAAGIPRVVTAWREPSLFVADCQGCELLEQAGVEVVEMPDFADRAMEPNRHLAL